MGLFEKAGRRFERFKKQAESAAEAEATHECAACGERLYADNDRCPECGAGDVVRIENEETEDVEGTDSAEETDPVEDTGDEANAVEGADGADGADAEDERSTD